MHLKHVPLILYALQEGMQLQLNTGDARCTAWIVLQQPDFLSAQLKLRPGVRC
jgi:hypothetical protein